MRERSIAAASAPTSAPGTRSRSASSASRTGAPHSICATAEPSSAASGPLVPFEISENTVAGERPDEALGAPARPALEQCVGCEKPGRDQQGARDEPEPRWQHRRDPQPEDSPGEGPAELRRHDRARLERSGETGARDPLREPQASRSAGERLAAGAAESPAGAFAQRSGELPDRAEEEEDRDRRERRRHRTVTRLRRRIAANPAS